MKYINTVRAVFVRRLNRFAAEVNLNGAAIAVHVKNTGRLGELLLSGAECCLEESPNPARKYKYDLVSVYKDGLGWVNVDSLAPNRVVQEWLHREGGFTGIKPEYTYGGSRVDFYAERGETRVLIEVKGCTLNRGGKGYFPDAPTVRGVKHLRELTRAAGEGFECCIVFVLAVPGIDEVLPNDETQPEFGKALREAVSAGVKVINLPCVITENGIYAK